MDDKTDFIDKTWEYVCELKKKRQGKVIYYDRSKELKLMELFIRKFRALRNEISINDLAEFARINSNDCSSSDDLRAKFNEFLKLKVYDFYFELGRTSRFYIGYQIGQGRLMPYSKLPIGIQTHFVAMASDDVPSRNYSDDIWFIHFTVKSLGQHKSIEKAIQAVKQSISIFRLTYLYTSDPYFPEAIISPLRYVGTIGNQILGVGYDFGGLMFHRSESYDMMISELSELVNKIDKNEIESRIINALEFFGMIENTTPLRIKFLLVIFALEGLLLSGDDKEYSLRKKLPEKIAFLILESANWDSVIHYIDISVDTSMINTIAKARASIVSKLEKIYDRRSAIAHGGVKDMSIYDFDFGSKVLRSVISKLIQLNRQGIAYVKKKGGLFDAKSLDGYLEGIKYS